MEDIINNKSLPYHFLYNKSAVVVYKTESQGKMHTRDWCVVIV